MFLKLRGLNLDLKSVSEDASLYRWVVPQLSNLFPLMKSNYFTEKKSIDRIPAFLQAFKVVIPVSHDLAQWDQFEVGEEVICFRYSLKCLWHEKKLQLIWQAFQKNNNDIFLFWNIFFFVSEISWDVFLLSKLGRWWRHKVCNWNYKILNKEYLWKYKSSILQSWHQKCSSQK